MFSGLKDKLTGNAKKLTEALKGEVTLEERKLEDVLSEIELTLIESDVAVEVVDKVNEDLKKAFLGKKIERGVDISKMVKEALMNSLKDVFVEGDMIREIEQGKRPFVIAFIGVNGTGKTTTIAKVSQLLKKRGLKPVIAAADTYRAGAIEQIEKHAENVDVKLIKHAAGSDSAAVAYDAIEHAKARGLDAVLIDTAGRMNTNVNLMDELKKVIRVSKPDLIIFVGDALTGNAVLDQVTTFNRYAPIDGAILTKADADPKGGSSISIAHTLKKPIYFLGTGQGYEDLIEFEPDWFLEQITPG